MHSSSPAFLPLPRTSLGAASSQPDAPATPLPDTPSSPLVTVGWREWVAFPELGLPAVRAKVDTGAATSALHAREIETVRRGGAPWARFQVTPYFRTRRRPRVVHVACEAPVVDERVVVSSSGHEDVRLVVQAVFRLGVADGAPEWPVEVTLADRRTMRFPMLLGREALAGHALVDAAATDQLGLPADVVSLYL